MQKEFYTNISPLRYPGGKTRACSKLDLIFNEHFNKNEIKVVLSPFFGGGSFEFFLQNKYNFEIIANDKFTPLYNFWKICKDKNEKLCDKLYKINDISKDTFTNFRNIILEESNKLKKAMYYFVINRCSFSGATLSGGFSEEASKKRFTKSSIDKIKSLKLDKFKITNKDCNEFINEYHETLNAFIFLDPPYYLEKGSKLYGTKGDMHETFDHAKLFESLSNKKNWMLTYNDCPYIRNLYKDFIIVDVDWSYGMNKSKKSSEIVIVSANN